MSKIIGIGGVSRSGKTHLSHDIVWYFRQQNLRAIAIRLDDYVKAIDDIPKIHDEIDWETPFSISYNLAIEAISYFTKSFDVVVIEGHLIYANKDLCQKINYPILLHTAFETYKRRKKADIRWGEIPQWYIDYIWEAFHEFGSKFIENPFIIKSDYPSINEVENYLNKKE